MKTSIISILILFIVVVPNAGAGPLINYSRELEEDFTFRVSIAHNQISLHSGYEKDFRDKRKVGDEEIERLYETIKDWIRKEMEEDDLTRTGGPSDSNAHIIVFSGSNTYSIDWNYELEGLPDFERVLCEIYGVTEINELIKKEPNQTSLTTPDAARPTS